MIISVSESGVFTMQGESGKVVQTTKPSEASLKEYFLKKGISLTAKEASTE